MQTDYYNNSKSLVVISIKLKYDCLILTIGFELIIGKVFFA
jgi:hypothetical protein